MLAALSSFVVSFLAKLIIDWLKSRSAAKALRDAGRGEARAERAEADLRIAKRQGEIMIEQRTSEDAAQRLDRGDF